MRFPHQTVGIVVVLKHQTGRRKIGWSSLRAHHSFAKHTKCTKLVDAVENTQSRHHHLARLFAMPAFGEPLAYLGSKSLFFAAGCLETTWQSK